MLVDWGGGREAGSPGSASIDSIDSSVVPSKVHRTMVVRGGRPKEMKSSSSQSQ
jgi:hypothetical protein